MDWLVGLLTLVVLKVILGLDNVIFISILAAKKSGPVQVHEHYVEESPARQS